MQISSRCSLVVHILICIDAFKNEDKVISDFLTVSMNVNPVMVRKIFDQLKVAGIVNVVRGSGGAAIVRPLHEISFLDIYRAVECIDYGELFHFHENPNSECPVKRKIHHILDEKLEQVQRTMEAELEKITLLEGECVKSFLFNKSNGKFYSYRKVVLEW